jgi:hypothetical protein
MTMKMKNTEETDVKENIEADDSPRQGEVLEVRLVVESHHG